MSFPRNELKLPAAGVTAGNPVVITLTWATPGAGVGGLRQLLAGSHVRHVGQTGVFGETDGGVRQLRTRFRLLSTAALLGFYPRPVVTIVSLFTREGKG